MAEKTLFWTRDMDTQLISLLAGGVSQSEVARILGVHRVQLLRRIKDLGLDRPKDVKAKEDESEKKKFSPPPHVENFQRTRRGFHVPPHLEPSYYALLKKGLSIDAVCKRLKINRDQGA